jgi:hypothetical protein
MPISFPAFLFASTAALAALIALLEWRVHRRFARATALLAGFAALCFVTNYAWARISIRVDLLVTIPAVSLAALIAGARAMFRPPAPARIAGAFLAVVGGVSFCWFAWNMARATAERRRSTAAYNEGNRLYWDETIRCEGNFEKRFGPVSRRDHPCYGNFIVTSRSTSAYPFTRVIVNDRGDAYLLFSPQDAMEAVCGLREGALARVEPAPDGGLAGEGDLGLGRTRIQLRRTIAGGCEAAVTRNSGVSTLGLMRQELPACNPPANPPVRYAGAWGKIMTDPRSATTRRLLQIWMWEASGQVRGVLATDVAPSGMRRDFVFLRHFHGTQTGSSQWQLRLENFYGEDDALLTMTVNDGRTRITGPEIFTGAGGQAVLDPGEVVSDPRIALVPLQDRALFQKYIDDALFNFRIGWKAP